MKKNILLIMTGLCDLIIGIGPWTVFRICDSTEKVMKCTYSSRVATGISVVILFNVLIMLLNKDNGKSVSLHVNNILLSIFVVCVDTILIGGCSVATMRCQQITFPIVHIVSVIIVVLSVCQILINAKEKE